MKKYFFYIEFQLKLNIAKAIYLIIRFFKTEKIIKIVRKKIFWTIRLNDIVGLSIYLIGGFQLRKLRKFSKILKSETLLVDIGANLGSFSIGMATINENIQRIITIEPDYENIELLQKNIFDNKLSEKVLISNSFIGELNPDSPSKYPLIINNKNLNYFNGEPGNFNDTESFNNDIISSNIKNLDLAIKIDVDGNEAKVVQSLSNIIEKHKPKILIEINKILLTQQELDYLISFFKQNNYKILSGKKLKNLNSIYTHYKQWGMDLILITK